MNKLYWHTCGEGDRDLVLLHGWGLNAEVWRCILPRLSTQFRVHLVDLPGYGRSQGFGALTLEQMSDIVMQQAPDNAVWLGWSMGGLVASDIALRYPERVAALVTVSSSPCFTAQGEWPGIKSEVLSGFQRQLSEDFKRTVERFLALQTLGTESARQDARILKDVVLTQPMPSVEVLNGGLDILRSVDLREQMADLNMPLLRIYGYLDGLVPRKVAGLLDESCPNSESVVIQKSAHAPFVSHPGEFCGVVESWVQEVGKV